MCNKKHKAGDVIIKDSGKRQKFSTGARRDIQEGKGRYDLLPFHAIERLSKIFEAGALKYGENNWRAGIPLCRYLDSALRHLCKAAQGQKDEDHFAMAVWNICCLMETKFMIDKKLFNASKIKELDNLTDWFNTEE
jgi:hypothetical protein